MKNLLFPLFCLLTLAISCKKSDTPVCEDGFGDGDCVLDFEEMLVETFIYDGGYSETCSYDSEARLVKISASDLLLTFDYSMADKVLSQLIYIRPGQPNDTTQRVFLLENGLTAEYIRTLSDGTVNVRVYERNPDGTIKKESYFNNNQLLSYIEYEYDADGNGTVARYKDQNGILQIARTWIYGPDAPQNTIITGKVFRYIDQPKKPTQMVETYSSSNPASPQITTTNFTYELDEHGRIVKEIQDTGTDISVTQFFYTI